MTGGPLACPVGLDELLDHLLDETGADRSGAIEDHLFECDACAERLESLERLREAVAGAARRGEVAANVTTAFLERAVRDGLTVREYRITDGGTVLCSAGPEDLWVVRLAGEFGDLHGVDLEAEFHDLEHEAVMPMPGREVVIDHDLGEVILVFPGDQVRGYPRSRWTMRLHGEGVGGPLDFGPFVMDHTP